MDQKVLSLLGRHIGIFQKLFQTDKVFVAGGALRDLDNEKDIKDIDIFVWADDRLQKQAQWANKDTSKHLTYAGDLEKIYGKESTSDLQTKKYGNRLGTGLRFWDIRTIPHRNYPIQLILYNHVGRTGPKVLLQYFDIDLCKISYDGERVYRTNEYKVDVENKTITVNPYCVNDKKTQKRVAMLEKKFGFEPIIPEAQTPEYQEGPSLRFFQHSYDDLLQRYSQSTSVNFNTISSGTWTGR